jgi:hypothetical protein
MPANSKLVSDSAASCRTIAGQVLDLERHDDDEAVARGACDEVDAAQRVGKALCHLPRDLARAGDADRILDVAQAIDADAHDRDARPRRRRPIDRAPQVDAELHRVRQVADGVELAQAVGTLLGTVTLRLRALRQDAEGEVVGQFLEQRDFVGSEDVHFRRVDRQHAEHVTVVLQRQREQRAVALLQYTRSPRPHRRLGRDVLHPLREAAADRAAGRAGTLPAVAPADDRADDVAHVGATTCHDAHGLVGVVLAVADPGGR